MTDTTFKKYCAVIDEWFINGFNGTQAYLKIYTRAKERTAEANFRKIHAFTRIQDYIKLKQEKALEYSELTHKDILRELESFAMLDPTQIVTVGAIEKITSSMDKDGNTSISTETEFGIKIRDFDELTDVQRRSIQSIKPTKEGIHITFFDKKAAFEMLNKHKGFYAVDNKQKQPNITQVMNIDPLEDYDKTDDSATEDIKS